MHAACSMPVRLVPFGAALLVLIAVALFADEPSAEPTPLPSAHAHNDYWHDRPLLGALDRGFGSVEADVFLSGGELLVGHDEKELRPERTLETLYLAPLRERIKANGGSVYPDGPTVFLLVDVKSDAEATYAALHELLSRYADVVSTVRDGSFERKAVTVVVTLAFKDDSGNLATTTRRLKVVK